jgi:AcrR family transcriptional regulator
MNTRLQDLTSERRDAILNAALKEFSLKGFDDASTNKIAKAAGISKSLMFHYVSSKHELFLFVYDYFAELLNREYYQLINYDETDIFNRLRQSYALQIKLLKKYPWILDFSKLSSVTSSNEINNELTKRHSIQNTTCYPSIFELISEARFRANLDIEKCKQIIYWSNVGFTNQILETIRNTEHSSIDYIKISKLLNEYINDLESIFYQN